MKDLTKAEKQVMQYLWKLEKAYLKDIVEQFPTPAPAYTTISTVIRTLVKKGFIGYTTHGKSHEYHALVSKEEYFKPQVKGMIKDFFSGSTSQFASFFTSDEALELKELEDIKSMIEEKIAELKKNND